MQFSNAADAVPVGNAASEPCTVPGGVAGEPGLPRVQAEGAGQRGRNERIPVSERIGVYKDHSRNQISAIGNKHIRSIVYWSNRFTHCGNHIYDMWEAPQHCHCTLQGIVMETLTVVDLLGRWNGGGSFRGREWSEKEGLPSDAEIVMHCVAAYFDSRVEI